VEREPVEPSGRGRRRPGSLHLRRTWDENAQEWIAWARAPGHDSYWRFHRDQFLELLPEPGERTLDLGCGEGRLGRDLSAAGHRIVGLDGSPTLARAALDADPSLPMIVGDAARLPLRERSFDLVVAFMILQDVDDLADTARQIARVLRPEGRLCLAIVHPLNSSGVFTGRAPDSPLVIEGSYLASGHYVDQVERDGLPMTFAGIHRPLEAYVRVLRDAGFLIEDLREPAVPDGAIQKDADRRWQRVPLFLHVRAIRP
jgi:SAM-dependent methyltransferase